MHSGILTPDGGSLRFRRDRIRSLAIGGCVRLVSCLIDCLDAQVRLAGPVTFAHSLLLSPVRNYVED